METRSTYATQDNCVKINVDVFGDESRTIPRKNSQGWTGIFYENWALIL